MMLTAEDLLIAKHEAAHAAAYILFGNRVTEITRQPKGHEGLAGYTAVVIYGLKSDARNVAEDVAVALLVPIYYAPLGDRHRFDLRKAEALFAAGVDRDRASRRAHELTKDPRFRRLASAIEAALDSRPTLSADDVLAIVDGL